MTIELNHTIVPANDKEESARLFADIFGLQRVQCEGSSGHFLRELFEQPEQFNRVMRVMIEEALQ